MTKMTDLGIVHDTTELRKLIAENPDLPIVVLAGEQAWIEDYSYTCCTEVSCKIGWVLDCEIPFGDGIVPTDEDDFKEQLENYLCDLPECENLSDEEFDKRLKDELAKYEPYWKKVIAIYADN